MWTSIIGHGRQIDQLCKAISSGRLPNAYLFAGPRGVGKRRAADELAASLVCSSPDAASSGACGTCLACRKAASRTHPDLFLVLPEAQDPGWKPPEGKEKKPSEVIKVEQVRALQSALQFHPLEAKAKLAIIDDADRMNASTANSLLKILEEPPPLTHFALVSTMPNSLLPTIRSRSARLDFGPLSDGEIAAKIASEKGVAREEALRIARLSGGSLGTALAIDPEFLSDTIGRFLTLCRKASTADVLATAEGWSHRSPGEIRLTFDLLASFYRDCLRIAAAGGEVSAAHPEAFEMAPRIGAARASRALSDIDSARRSFDTTANKQLMFENLLFSLTS